jgi:hypothetical protein
MIWLTDNLYILLGTTSNTALSLIYTLFRSIGHAKSSQCSLVVSWERIYNSLTVTSVHTKFFFFFTAQFQFLNHLRRPTLSLSRHSFNSSRYVASWQTYRKHPSFSYANRSHRNMFASSSGAFFPQEPAALAMALPRCFIFARMCLSSRCLTVNLYSAFTIPGFGWHVTVRNRSATH